MCKLSEWSCGGHTRQYINAPFPRLGMALVISCDFVVLKINMSFYGYKNRYVPYGVSIGEA